MKDLHKAIYVPDGFCFNGPVRQNFPNGAVILMKGKRCWGIDSGIFIRNYRAVIGSKERKLVSIESEFNTSGRMKRV